MRLIEPLGFVSDYRAIPPELVLPLRGGPTGFTLARLIGDGVPEVVPVAAIPREWETVLQPILQRPPPWAGLTLDAPVVMGILNVTPDSFSDGGRLVDPGSAIAAGLAMAAAGAAILDVGGESTRPGAAWVSPQEEQARVLPVIRALAEAGLRVSVDTRNAATMELALDAGAVIVNDVSALTHDPDAVSVVARRGAYVVLMHMRGNPATMNELASYDDVTVEVVAELAARIATARAGGVLLQRIVIDPGIGFAKTMWHNLELLKRLSTLCNIPCPIMVGVSRKSFIGKIAGIEQADRRLAGSIVAGLRGIEKGASILRVHDVSETIQAFRLQEALTRC